MKVLFQPSNTAATNPNHTDANLRTRFYRATFAEVEDNLKKLVPLQRTYARRWRIVRQISNPTSSEITIEVPVVIFTDDLIITLRQTDDEIVAVDVRSASRVGRHDFGENVRHIKQLLQALDVRVTYL